MREKRLAMMRIEIKGKFTRWPVGTIVLACSVPGVRWYLIERVKWKGRLPLTNQCAGVPRRALEFL